MTDYCLNGSKDQCETQIYDALTNFGTDFASYQTAYNTYVSSKTTATTDSYNKSLSKIQTDISNLDMYITEYVSTNSQKGKLPSGKVYQDIVTKYKKILEERDILDRKIYDLYTNEYDSTYSIKPMVDSNVLTGIMLTVLATTMIYYIIVKL